MLAIKRSTDLCHDVTRTSSSVINRILFYQSYRKINFCSGPQKSDLLELLTQIRQGKLSSNNYVRLERLQVEINFFLTIRLSRFIRLQSQVHASSI